MNAYSKDLRLRVLAAVDRGERREEIVRLFGVSVATIGRWLRRRKDTGEVAPRPSPGRTPSILRTTEERDALWRQLEASPEGGLQQAQGAAAEVEGAHQGGAHQGDWAGACSDHTRRCAGLV